jgi:medium-chain acyl-[acyl-carrier-protein] hydrolase
MSKTSEKKKVWIDEYTIRSYEVDTQKKATLPTLCRFLQETAYHHAHNLGFGYEHLKKKKQFWVLSRLIVKMVRYPEWGDTIEVHTWPSGVERLFALRDFKILDEKGDRLGAAVSAWIILNSEKRRPQRPDHLKEEIGYLTGQPVFEQRPDKIPGLSNPRKGPVFPVRYSDLDLYDHVNNVKYIQWIVDSYPAAAHREFKISGFEINFLSEAKYGDKISICTETYEESPPRAGHSVKREADYRDVCLARARWI